MANLIPKAFINELLTRVDIVDVIDTRVPLKKKGHNYTACCPFHNEKTPSFSVSQAKQFYYCFGCSKSGNAISFLMDYERMEFVEAIESLAGQFGIEVPRTQGQKQNKQTYNDLYQILDKAADFFHRQLKTNPKAVSYLKNRGLNPDIIEKFQLGYARASWDQLMQQFSKDPGTQKSLEQAGMTIQKDNGGYYDRFRDRVMFPIKDRQGRCVAFGGRIMGDGQPKYLNSPETPVFHKGSELYGLYQSLKSRHGLDYMLVVEGYMDLLTLVQHGYPNTVATLGTATTKFHLERLFKTTTNIVFCFDGDNAGRKAAWRALETCLQVIDDKRGAKFIFLPDGEDPDSVLKNNPPKFFANLVEKAQTLSSFFFEHLVEQVDLSHMDGRARFSQLATPLIDSMQESVFKQIMIEETAKLTRIAAEKLLIQQNKSVSDTHQHDQNAAKKSVQERLSPMRLAITLLLQQPSLIEELNEIDWLEKLEAPGVEILQELIKVIQANPTTNTGLLLEHWRDQDAARHLVKLAQWELNIPEGGFNLEFQGAIECIKQLALDQQIEQLLIKANRSELSLEEKQALQLLIKESKS